MKESFQSDTRYLKLDITFPYKEMLAEAIQLKDKFIPHRNGGSQGWESLVLHGLGEGKTESWKSYGYNSGYEAGKDMHWTEAAKKCPVTMNYFLNNFPCKKYGRVRFMLLKPGGYIDLHSDSRLSVLENTNMVLSQPNNCSWIWGDGQECKQIPGEAYVMNIHYHHGVYNNSNEDRYHIIVARHDHTPEWKKLINKACVAQNVSGEYITLPDMP